MKTVLKNSYKPVALCLLLLLSSLAQAATSMEQLLRLGGLERQLAEFPEQVSAGISAGINSQSQSGPVKELPGIVSKALVDVDLFGTISKRMESQFSNAEVEKLMLWYRSELAREITELEVQASSPETQERIAAQLNSLLANSAYVARAKRMDELLKVTDYTLVIAEVSQLAIIDGMLASNPEALASRDAIVAQLSEQLKQLRPQIEQGTIASLSYTYQSLNDAQFDSYLEFLNRPDTEKFNTALQDEMTRVMRTTFDMLGKKLGAFMSQQAETAQP